MNRPVLAYIVHSLDPGGTERLVVGMALAFAGDFDVRVWCLDRPGAWASTLRKAGIPVKCLWRQQGIDLSIAIRLARQLRFAGASIIHAHQCTPWFYAALSRLVWRRPRLLLEEHGRFWPEVDSPWRRIINRVLIDRLTHRRVAVSMDVACRLERYEGLQRDRIEVIHNGVDASELESSPQAAASLRAALGFGPKHVVLCFVGRLDEIKNLPLLVAALSEVVSEAPMVRALIVGDGPQRAAIEASRAAAGLSARCVMTGHREDARALIACSDLFVLPSLSEGISLALLESMAEGVPAIVTNVGGNVDVVVDADTGWVVPSGDTRALSVAIRHAATDQGERTSRGRAARRRHKEHFGFDRMIDRYRRIYRNLLSQEQRADIASPETFTG